MRVHTMLKASVAAVGLVLALPAFAQSGGPVNTTDSEKNVIVNDLLDVFLTDQAADSYSTANSFSKTDTKVFTSTTSVSKDNGSYNGNTSLAANQYLKAVNINRELDEVADFDGEDGTETPVGYNSGANSVNDNAFAAFAGISNISWNSGLNANTQAATNIAAQGTVNFGMPSGGTGGGGD